MSLLFLEDHFGFIRSDILHRRVYFRKLRQNSVYVKTDINMPDTLPPVAVKVLEVAFHSVCAIPVQKFRLENLTFLGCSIPPRTS